MLNRFSFLFAQKSPSLVYCAHGKHGKSHTIYSMEDDKIYKRRIPQLAQKRLLLCKYGWLVMGHPQTNPRLKRLKAEQCSYSRFSLINPISMERIDLPPVPPWPPLNQRLKKRCRDSSLLVDITASRTDDDCIIFLIDRNNRFIKFCYLREKRWFVRILNIQSERYLIEFKATATLNGAVYCLTDCGRLVNIIFNGDQVTTELLNVEKPKEKFRGGYSFLIESKGELYNIMCSLDVFQTKTIKDFNVFKMDFSLTQWVAVSDIGDRAFFLDLFTDGLSCDVCDQTGFQKNCIYYINDNNYIYQYSLEDWSVVMSRPSDKIETPFYQPIWVQTQCLQDETCFDNYTRSSKNNLETCSDFDLDTPKQFPNKYISSTSRQEAESWPNLLPELVLQIIPHLSYLDSRYAGIAIPKWHHTIRSAQKPISSNWQNSNPCHLSFLKEYKTCRLLDPLRNGEWLIKSSNISGELKIVYCKHGWLLLRLSYSDLIFYNPLSQAVIELPHFEYCADYHFSFSSPPTSSDCVVVASIINNKERDILICCKGDSNWDQIIYDDFAGDKDNPQVESTNAVFSTDSFYWLLEGGEIGVFNLIEETFEFRGKTNENISKSQQWYLGEYNDELFLVLATHDGSSVRVYKLDRSNYEWEETKSLGGCSFFLSHKNSIALSSPSSGDKGDRIYFPWLQDKQFVYYSMQNRKFFPNRDFITCKELPHKSSWIEPHWAHYTSEELCWSDTLVQQKTVKKRNDENTSIVSYK